MEGGWRREYSFGIGEKGQGLGKGRLRGAKGS